MINGWTLCFPHQLTQQLWSLSSFQSLSCHLKIYLFSNSNNYTERWLQQTQYVGELKRKIQRKFCIVLYIFQQTRHNFIYLLTSLPSCPGSPGDPLDPRLPCGKGNQTFWTILSLTIVSIQLNFANQKSLKGNKVNCHNLQSWRSSLQVFTSSFLQLSSYVLQ